MTENENAPPVMADGVSSVGGPAPAFSAPAFSALRHDANDLPWPQRPWIMAALCAVAGVIFYLLVDGGDQSPLRQAAGVFVAVSTLAFVLTVELRRWQWSAVFAIGWGVVVAGVGFYTAQYNRNGEIAEFPFLAGIFAVLLAAPLFQAARDVGSRNIDYLRTHNHIWNDAVIGAAAMAFTGLTFLLMFLLASLFDLVGMDFLQELMNEEEFNFGLAGAAFGAAVGILRERDALVGTMQRLVMVVLSVLAPVLAVGLVIFLVSLPFTGLQPLWDSTKATTPILMFCAAGAFLLANVVIGNGAEDRFDNRILQKAAMLLALCILPLAIIAAISMGLRIQQYGWTPSRIWGALVVVVALAYGLTYLWSIIKGRTNWEILARAWNLRGAMALVAIAVFLALPIVDFGSISARDQLARLKSGETPIHKFDWAAMAYDFGPKGREVVKSLTRDTNAEIASAAKETLEANNRWDIEHDYHYDTDVDTVPLDKRLTLVGSRTSQTDRTEILSELRKTRICSYGPCTVRKLNETTWLISGKRYQDGDSDSVLLLRQPYGEPSHGERATQVPGWEERQVVFFGPDGVTVTNQTLTKADIEADTEWRPAPRQQLYINGRPTDYYIDE